MDRQKQDELKQAAAKQAAGLVEDGMILGVGTGSTVKFFIDELGRRKEEEGLALKAVVTTSSRSRKQLEGLGFTVSELADIDQADLTVDGADRVDKQLNGIKGGGAALTLEKNVAVNSKKNVWIVDESKVVDHLSGFPLPVEVLPISCEQNKRRFEAEGPPALYSPPQRRIYRHPDRRSGDQGHQRALPHDDLPQRIPPAPPAGQR